MGSREDQKLTYAQFCGDGLSRSFFYLIFVLGGGVTQLGTMGNTKSPDFTGIRIYPGIHIFPDIFFNHNLENFIEK